MGNKSDFIGYLEYHGQLVDDGIMDARKTARALIGFDSSLRHFAGLQFHPLRDLDYEIPVAVRTGSWQALIPTSLEQWMITAAGLTASTYALTAVAEIAKNDFRDVSLKHIFIGALRSIQWIIRIGKHLGTLRQKRFTSVQWRNGNTEVGIPNEKEQYLFVPKEMLDAYTLTPSRILSDMASLIEAGRQLRIVVQVEEQPEIESINTEEKSIFYVPEEDSDILFPELEHGQLVSLEGVVTRGNENTNSIGFRFQDHILNCIPREGSIVRFKNSLFLKCIITGSISREDESGMINQKRPKIIFDLIEPIEEEPPELSLFEE